MNFNINNKQFLKEYPYIFIDFDGVIKDSVEVKSNAFTKLFDPFGQEVSIMVKNHHEENSGISRYEKIPLYLSWAGEKPSDILVKNYCKRFSNYVKQNVIDSNWVPGICEFLQQNYKKNMFFLVTATPKFEIDEIIEALEIKSFFTEVFGSPIDKNTAIKTTLKKYSIPSSASAMIGDTIHDFEAAKQNEILFLLRKTILNKDLQIQFQNCSFKDFINE